MPSVAVNSPKTPVTKGSNSVAAATVPNVCKMPGPPAPFVPTPLPNIGRSNLSPEGYSTSVKIEGEPVAIQGASFNSIGDIASKGTGGGIISNTCEGPTKFIGPGSLDVKDAKDEVGKLGSCRAGDSPALLKTKGNGWMKQGVARAKLDNTCFGGGNEGHQAAQATCWDHVGRCQGMGR